MSIVGVGGLGSPLALTLAKQEYPLTVYDPDVVEEKNTRNQLYGLQDVGQLKVEATAFLTDQLGPESMAKLSPVRRAYARTVTKATRFTTPVVISCVDSLAARKEILAAVLKSPKVKIFLDGRLGGTGVKILAVNPKRAKDVAKYRATLEGDAGIPACAQQFEGHVALVGAALLTRALRMIEEQHGVERMLLFDVQSLLMMRDGPHPW